jgi:hypothetical protein
MTDRRDPSFVVFDYKTPYSTHKMTVPTREWNAGIGTAGKGGYLTWNEDPRDADDMLKDFVTVIAGMYNDTTTFNHYTIFTFPTGETFSIPVAENALTIDGSGTITGWDEAVQRTYMIRDTSVRAFSRLVLLDAGTDNNFGKYTTLTTPEAQIIAEITDPDNAWSSRQGNRPNSFKNLTITLNEKLRREYKLT